MRQEHVDGPPEPEVSPGNGSCVCAEIRDLGYTRGLSESMGIPINQPLVNGMNDLETCPVGSVKKWVA